MKRWLALVCLISGCSSYGLSKYEPIVEESETVVAVKKDPPLPAFVDDVDVEEDEQSALTEQPSEDSGLADEEGEETEELAEEEVEDTGSAADEEQNSGQANSTNGDQGDHIDDDGDGFSEDQGDCDDGDNGVFPDNLDLAGDGIDQDCDGGDASGGGIQCAYNIEMICGNDGWSQVWLWVEAGSNTMLLSPQPCRSASQNWSPTVSQMRDIQLSPGQQISMQICYDEDCTGSTSYQQIGVILRANGTLLQAGQHPDDLWSYTHTCP